MSTTKDFIEYVCEKIPSHYEVRYRYMFGEYMIYINNKPLLLVCDNTVYVKEYPFLESEQFEETGYPYQGAKRHYILDMDDQEKAMKIIEMIEKNTVLKKKANKESK